MHGNTTHGDINSAEYAAWHSMLDRCYNPNNGSFHRYGGRGIVVWIEWRKDYSAFLRGVGRRPSARHSLERIDNNSSYKPGNVCWAVPKEQARNRSDNVNVTHGGKTQCLAAWAEDYGISMQILRHRIYKQCLPFGEALNRPLKKTCPRNIR